MLSCESSLLLLSADCISIVRTLFSPQEYPLVISFTSMGTAHTKAPPVCVAESFLLSSRHFHWNIPRISKMDLIIFSSKSAPTPRDTTAPLRITLASSGCNVDLHTSLLCLNSSLAAHCSHVKTHGCRQPFAVWPSPPPKLRPTPHSRSVCDRVVRSDTRLRYRHDATANHSVHRGPGVLQTLYQSLLPSVSYVTDTPALWGRHSECPYFWKRTLRLGGEIIYPGLQLLRAAVRTPSAKRDATWLLTHLAQAVPLPGISSSHLRSDWMATVYSSDVTSVKKPGTCSLWSHGFPCSQER